MAYVNRGPDPRILGPLGGWLQQRLSFQSSTPPLAAVARWGRPRWKVGVEFSRPWLLPFVLVFIPHARVRDRQRWYSFRAGWRWDRYWGRGGYVADVILKLRIDNLVE